MDTKTRFQAVRTKEMVLGGARRIIIINVLPFACERLCVCVCVCLPNQYR